MSHGTAQRGERGIPDIRPYSQLACKYSYLNMKSTLNKELRRSNVETNIEWPNFPRQFKKGSPSQMGMVGSVRYAMPYSFRVSILSHPKQTAQSH